MNFKKIFAEHGKAIVLFLRKNIESGGKDWIPFTPPTTKNKSGKGTHKRMIVSGNTKNLAFKYTASDTGLIISVPDKKYENIILGNNKDGPYARKNQVYLFPTSVSENTFSKLPVIQALSASIKKMAEDELQADINAIK